MALRLYKPPPISPATAAVVRELRKAPEVTAFRAAFALHRLAVVAAAARREREGRR